MKPDCLKICFVVYSCRMLYQKQQKNFKSSFVSFDLLCSNSKCKSHWSFLVLLKTKERFADNFYPRDAMLARVVAMVLCLSVYVCFCLLQVSVPLKRLNESRWVFWQGSFLRLIIHSVISTKTKIIFLL